MIANKDRSGYIGASDTGYVMRRWNTKSFAKWWREKQGFVQNNICTDAMKAGTAWEHKVLDALNIPGMEKDKQIIKTTKIMHEAYGGLLAHTATFSELWERNDGKKLLLLINASAKKTSACIQGEIPDGVYLIDGCVQREITVQNGTFEAELPPHTVSYIIF